MASPNAPILAKILEAIIGITIRLDTIERNTELRFDRLETRMSNIESKLSTIDRRLDLLEANVASLIDYNRNKAITQELIFTNKRSIELTF